MLERQDDAFATGLRLVGRCIANGAKVDVDLWREVAVRLTRFLVSATWRNRDRVGRMIVDSFSDPLLKEIRAVLGYSWLMHSGAGEIVNRANDAVLTREVLISLLTRDLHRFMVYAPLQPALNRLGNEALQRYAERARKTNTTADELSGLSDLVGALDPSNLTAEVVLDVALDQTLPEDLRLAAFYVMPQPRDDLALPVILRALRSENARAAFSAISRSEHPTDTVVSLMKDLSLTLSQRKELAKYPGILFPDREERMAYIRRCLLDKDLSSELQSIMRVFAARYGDDVVFDQLVSELLTIDIQVALTLLSLLGHRRSRPIGIQAAEAMRNRGADPEVAVRIAEHAATGLTSVFEMDTFGSGPLATSSPHPAVDVWAELVESWMTRGDLEEMQLLRVAVAAARLGSARAIEVLEASIGKLRDPDSPRFRLLDEYGNHTRAAVEELRTCRRLLSLDVGERLVRSVRPNVPYAGIAIIRDHADRPALGLLVRLHNELADGFVRESLSDAIETLAARLDLSVNRVDRDLVLVNSTDRVVH